MDQPAAEFVVVLCTAPDRETAHRIGRTLVDDRLAACVNIAGGLLSVYRWEGTVHEDPEVLLLIKTRRAMAEKLTDAISRLHPYAVPEVLALPVLAGVAPYLAWLGGEVGG